MILLVQNIEDYNNDLRVSLQAFFGGVKVVVPENVERKPELADEIDMALVADFSDEDIWAALYEVHGSEDLQRLISSGAGAKTAPVCETHAATGGDCRDKAAVRNPLKLALYEMLSGYTGRRLPWGSLTGVRPTKLAMAYMEEGHTPEEAVLRYVEEYETSEEKARLATQVAVFEKAVIESVAEEDEYCLYIGIPFCPTRCLYCSFTSYPIGVYRDKVDAYLDALETEMTFAAKAYEGKRLISIYIGGGTPSSISAEQTDRLCGMVERLFDLSHVREFTVEAGRPDSTTYDKLVCMKRHGVTRVSINPQTMNEETLAAIGRAHTPEQTEEAMRLARQAGFDNINMDLIVGLPGEDEAMVRRTLARIRELAPESLTVHTLAVKRAANLKQQMDRYRDSLKADTDRQLAAVTEAARELGLVPYYLYRQKNMTGNLENVGYARKGLECLYNILIMEERTDILGLGAGSSSKLVFHAGRGGVTQGTRIDRVENCKSVDDYIARIDEMIERKRVAFGQVTADE